ncbi:hypothetical protein ACIQPQ_04105 [Streptomyces sp. NPDC091281]|uniref:hypothetical protein n=1 Tax=Streptomyces sp. NPDC091281 TaxID=3365985 RepID=UPI00381FE3A6
MAEHDSDREDRDEREGAEGTEGGEGRGGRDGARGREGGHGREPEEQSVPFDEAAAWEAIVAAYGEEPADPPGAKPFKSVEDLALLEAEPNDGPSGPGAPTTGHAGAPGTAAADPAAVPKAPDVPEAPEKVAEPDAEKAPAQPLGGSVSFAPGVGPRDYSPPEPAEEDLDADDEGHFVPPEPPPLPPADTTAKFAWLGVIGGPILLLLTVVLGWDMTWWLGTLAIGGFLGGFATLVARMGPDDEENDGDPGRGAVV